ncbi:unnamed protein product [Cladocopium goreaui]|uniref:Large neutral amino acids transporter small subunit 4 n=1 Tax=Cladocopium goreaui TaxID=2562237 RepID=A0A9P1G9K8_9DINO|nr:unnamed protein product [Cladocopium goreaui]
MTYLGVISFCSFCTAEVWKHLQSVPQNKVPLSSVTTPKAVKDAWAELQTTGSTEGVTKTAVLKSVLGERADLFEFAGDTIELTEAAQMMNPTDGLPDNILTVAGGLEGYETKVAEEEVNSVVVDAAPGEAPRAVGQVGGGRKARMRTSTYIPPGKGKGKGKTGLYSDMFWTPLIAQALAIERKKDSEMVRALFTAIELHSGKCVTLSQLGSDFKVSQLKKDNMWKSVRLLDILEAYEDIFELVPDNTMGGWQVKLQPGAEAALPDVEEYMEREIREQDALPPRIENPRTAFDKMQSLRIELLYALQRRGNKVQLQELGQEPRVQKVKQSLHQAKKLIEFIRMFPTNFKVSSDDSQMIIEVISPSVSDQSMIDRALQRLNQDSGDRGKGSRKDARGGREPARDRGRRDRSRSRGRREAPPPHGYLPPGYGPPPGYAPPPGYPYGYPVPPGYGQPPPQPAYPVPAYDYSQQYAPPPQAPPAQPAGYPPPVGYPPPAGYSYPPPAGYPPPGYAPPPAGYLMPP